MGLERKDRTQFNPWRVGLLKAGLFLVFFFFSKGVLALRKLLGFFAWMGKS
jgi:hypothetical protein